MSDTIQIVCPRDGAINRVPAGRLAERPVCGRCHQPLFTGEPADLDAAQFDSHLASSSIPFVVDFWAPWCGPCLSMAPAYKEATATLEPSVRLAKIDTDGEPQLAARLGIRSIPTMIVFAGGREVARRSGAIPAAQIVAWVRGQLK